MEVSRKETRLEKYLDYLNPDIEIKPRMGAKDKEYLELMRTAFHWRTQFFSPDQVRRMLMKPEGDVGEKRSYSTACQIYADMEYVYGKTAHVDKDALKRIVTENYYKTIQLIYKSNAEDWEKAKRIESITDKIVTLYGLSDGSAADPDQLMPERVVQIIVNSGPGEVKVANVLPGGGND